jgi:hypothetical protein
MFRSASGPTGGWDEAESRHQAFQALGYDLAKEHRFGDLIFHTVCFQQVHDDRVCLRQCFQTGIGDNSDPVIGPSRKSADVRSCAAFGGQADIRCAPFWLPSFMSTRPKSAELVERLEQDLKQRMETVKKLQEEHEKFAQLSQVSKDQAAALTDLLKNTLSSSARRERLFAILINIIAGITVFVLGIIFAKPVTAFFGGFFK